MRRLRGWRLVGAAAVAVVAAGAVAFMAVTAGDDADDGSVAVGSTRSTTTSVPAPTAPVTEAPIPSTTLLSPTSAVAPRTTPTAAPTTAPPPPACAPPRAGSDFDGFGATEIVVEGRGGRQRSCTLTADTPPQHQRGLMHQDDLGGYAGMIFRFPTEEHRAFWMRNTRIPLSIAFFDGRGAFVSATDMEPCGDSQDCPRYTSNGAAMYALEVPKGGLQAVGATPGSRLVVS